MKQAHDEASGVYYVEMSWAGLEFYGDLDLQLGLVAAQGTDYVAHWDPNNDWSRQEITETRALTRYVTVYSDGELIWGEEP